jgi:hypothetical protein
MKTFKQVVNESKSDYPIYHESYTSAIDAMEKFVNKKKFVLDPEEMFTTVGGGPRKPGAGKTNRFSMKIYKNQSDLDAGKAQKKYVHFQIYGMGSMNNLSADKYELNAYIS